MNRVGVEPVLQLVVINLFSTSRLNNFCLLSILVEFLGKDIETCLISFLRTHTHTKKGDITALKAALKDLISHT